MSRIASSSRLPLILYASLSLVFLAACSIGTPVSTPTPSQIPATPTPTGPQVLNVCMASEPSSLYLYGDSSSAARTIRQAIYDGPIDTVAHLPAPVILENLPSMDNGITIQSVAVHAGDKIVVDGNVTIATGDMQLDQLVVTFTLKNGLLWSDGQPLTADDSVYSFELNSSEPTASHYLTDRTASYAASGELTTTWTGLPGFIDPNAATDFWTPLPRHAWSSIASTGLLTNEASARKPVGWGPYVIDDWTAGQHISLSRNPNYFRAGEGLPYFSTLNFVFIGSDAANSANALANGTCDVLLSSTGLPSVPDGASGAVLPAGYWLHLDFGIVPQSYDDGIGFGDRPNFFADPAMRQALAHCIDRGAIIAQLGGGNGSLPATYLPAGDPRYNNSATNYAFDPDAANAQLDGMGWLAGEDGVRTSQGTPTFAFGTRLELNLVTSDSAENSAAAQIVKNSLDDCGVAVNITTLLAEQAFATGPTSKIFGRNFDLAIFSWPFDVAQSGCYLYLSEAIPGSDLATHKYGWGGWNVSGWQNTDFDAACKQALSARPGDSAAADAQRNAQQIFADQVPALPLFVPNEVIAARADFCNLDAGAGTDLLAGLEIYGFAEWCQQK